MKRIDWLIILFLIIFSVFTLKDLFLHPGFYSSHDGIHQVIRLYYFDELVHDGQIPPRWVGGLLNGFGYPLFNFSYQIPWMIAEPFVLLGFSIFDSIKLTFLIGYILSGIFMYYYQKEVFGRWPAVVGTILYLYAPYRFSNIFVRGAIGDATSFIFPPLLFLSLFKLKNPDKKVYFWVGLGAIAFSGILLSHAMVFFFYILSITVYILFSLIFLKQKKIFILSAFSLVVLGFAISAYYFIPSLIERDWTQFSSIMGPAFIGNTFVSLRNLFYSPWGYGTIDAKEGAMSLQVGFAQWSTFSLSLISIGILLVKKKFQEKNTHLFEAVTFVILFIASIFIMSPASLFLWKIMSNFIVIDFTWRVLSITVFSASVLAGFVASRMNKYLIISLFIVILAIYSNRNHLRINQTLDWPLDLYLKLELTTNSSNEYVPKWVNMAIVKNKLTQKVEYTDNEADIILLGNRSNYINFVLNAKKQGLAKINTVYYPGWKVWVDGKTREIIHDPSGFMEINFLPGKYDVVAKFTETPLRQFSNLLTVLSFVFTTYLLAKFKTRKE